MINEEKQHSQEQWIVTHPFEFGFRYPVINKLARIHNTKSEVNAWHVSFPPPKVEDKVWYGNCVQDAIITATSLRRLGIKSSIIKIDVDSIGNSPRGFTHFRAVSEHGLGIDHSRFFQTFVNSNVVGYKETTLSEIEEEKLINSHTPVTGRLVEKAYSEIIVNGSPVLFEVSIWRGDDFRIGFDVTQPLSEHPDYRAYLPIPFGLINTKELEKKVDNFDFPITYGHPGQSGFTSELLVAAKNTLPLEVFEALKRYFREMISAVSQFSLIVN